MENYQIWLELVKICVWPFFWLVVIVVASWFLWPFIKNRFSDVTKISYGSLNLEFDKPLAFKNEMQQQGQKLLFYDAYASPVVNQDKKLIFDDLNSRNLSNEDQKQLLIHELANQRVYNQYWRITNNIYIEQIHLLKHLNNGILLTKEEMQSFYDQYANVKKGSCGSLSSLEQFFAWLSSNQLIIEHPNACYSITHKGRDYLRFLISIGHSVMSSDNNNK